jgi:hypothetical protein
MKTPLTLAGLFTALSLLAQSPTPPARGAFTGSMPARDGGPPLPADGPWNRDVIAYRASASGAVEKVATFERAGVPTIARLKDGRLIVAHQHFPENDRENFDTVAVRFSRDDGKTWGTPQVIQVTSLPEGMRFPFDPTLVPLPDGRVRLYFTGNMRRAPSTPAIHSAISTDGVNYTYEPGVRFAVAGRAVIDCAVVLHNGVFHLYAPDNGAGNNPGDPRNRSAAERPREGVGYHATSKDGLNFTRVDDVQIEGRRRWLGNAQSDGKLITFYGTGEGMNTGGPGGQPRGGLWMASSTDGKNWKLTPNPPIGGGDPGAVATRDGGLIVIITGPPVRGPMAGSGTGAPPAPRGNVPRGESFSGRRESRVETTGAKYQAAPGAKAGSFVTGQDADLMLGASGQFNLPSECLVADGRLFVCNRGFNRVDVWNRVEDALAGRPADALLGASGAQDRTPATTHNKLFMPGSLAWGGGYLWVGEFKFSTRILRFSPR